MAPHIAPIELGCTLPEERPPLPLRLLRDRTSVLHPSCRRDVTDAYTQRTYRSLPTYALRSIPWLARRWQRFRRHRYMIGMVPSLGQHAERANRRACAGAPFGRLPRSLRDSTSVLESLLSHTHGFRRSGGSIGQRHRFSTRLHRSFDRRKQPAACQAMLVDRAPCQREEPGQSLLGKVMDPCRACRITERMIRMVSLWPNAGSVALTLAV